MDGIKSIDRLDDAGLTEHVGAAGVALLRKRARGGAAGNKGVRYEQLFGAHRVARLIRKLLEGGSDALVEWQSPDCFLDDFIVRRDDLQSFKGYQLKNALQVSWTSGVNPIAQDFQMQYTVSVAEGYTDVRLRLVCSNQPAVPQLVASTPNEIAPYSKAIFFPHYDKLLPVLAQYDWLASDIAYLSKHEHATDVDVEQVLNVLMGAWACEAPKAHVRHHVKIT